ncbi:hypothetical protein LFYK43_12040 [Ligilactobacillus salitolerans]|uniref:Uncharacterized protein n=1 Tax=Ligilactobacillus salitolerans TaxID=1808352 RepID=A0A401ITB4_9LACO|nr:hypothetical protein [Ligilactobacillus salitolerans]GBG94745.1 hypothetical protein LFYK43_12040 [Ligilactobacillus salitolerans]
MVNKKDPNPKEKSELELRYEEFAQRKDLVVEIAGVKYQRVFDKSVLEFDNKKLFVVRAVKGLNAGRGSILHDENKHHFIVDGAEMLRFRGEIPDWYWGTVGFSIKPVETEDIGDYLTVE